MKNKTLHVVAFDVSYSMQMPLRLRSHAQDAAKNSDNYESKRVQTVFDVICRLAEDSILTAEDQDMYAAFLCFGLRNVNTCDLLALLEARTKGFNQLELPYQRVQGLLQAHGITSSQAGAYIKKVSRSNALSPGNEQLYTVAGYTPLVNLLRHAGAPYCGGYVERHSTPESAGKYFMAFATPDRAKDVAALVSQLPDACKDDVSFSRFATEHTPFMGPLAESFAACKAMQFADELMATQDNTLLASIPTATPKPLGSVVQLIRKLQAALELSQLQHTKPDGVGSVHGQDRSSNVNWERVLNDIEPYLYGGTPMCEALMTLLPTFQAREYTHKVLILISDGDATDGDPRSPALALRQTGGIIFACLLTDSFIKDPRRLRSVDEVDSGWSSEAQAMFNMASTASYDSGSVQALRRRGWEIPASGQCKLFIQANNPVIIDEFTTASRSLGTNSDALADMIGEISLDMYIQSTNSNTKVTDQGPRAICWAHATASVFHLASLRVVGRKVPDFFSIRSHLFNVFGNNDDGQDVDGVLSKTCPGYKLRYQKCDEAGARAAVHARRPVIATFVLDDKRWDRFSAFYRSKPKGTLTANDMSATAGGDQGGHAMVLVHCDATSLTFMNSWGPKFANNGFFTVDKASTLEITGGQAMKFYDVYWTIEDLSTNEIAKWDELRVWSVGNVIQDLPTSFHELPVDCPRCKNTTQARNYTGSWNQARCPTCFQVFTPTAGALLRSLYESNYSPL